MPKSAGSKYRDCAKGGKQIRGGSLHFRDTALGASLGNVVSLVSTSVRGVRKLLARPRAGNRSR